MIHNLSGDFRGITEGFMGFMAFQGGFSVLRRSSGDFQGRSKEFQVVPGDSRGLRAFQGILGTFHEVSGYQ